MRAFVGFEYKQMTIYRTRYRDPKRHSWVIEWSPTNLVAELRRIKGREAACTEEGRDPGGALRGQSRQGRQRQISPTSVSGMCRRFVSYGASAVVLMIGARSARHKDLESVVHGFWKYDIS
jgi:hypothetical protein